MAERPVFVPIDHAPFVRQIYVPFEWNGGFARVQKQKNVHSLHESFAVYYPDMKTLEISSCSPKPEGAALSAFSLMKTVPALDRCVPVECIYQGSKVFTGGGPYPDLMQVKPKEAKKDERLKESGYLSCFFYEGQYYPLKPKSIFYDYIYINALLENKDLAEKLMTYDAFTDIEFNPKRSMNCQAEAAAVYVALRRLGLLSKVRNFEDFIALYDSFSAPDVIMHRYKRRIPEKLYNEKEEQMQEINAGDILVHRLYGKGTVKYIKGDHITVLFEKNIIKKLSRRWCGVHCKVKSL